MNIIRRRYLPILVIIGLLQTGVSQAVLVDRGGGMIYDPGRDLTWLQDANYAKTSGYDADGEMDWDAANIWAAGLVYGGYDDWRLPMVSPINGISFNYEYTVDGSSDRSENLTSPNSELAYMFNVNLGNPSFSTPSGEESGCMTAPNACLTNSGPFINLMSMRDITPTPTNPFDRIGSWYWTSVDDPFVQEPVEGFDIPDTGFAWSYTAVSGFQDIQMKSGQFFSWAVRSGDVLSSPVPIPAGIWFMSTGLFGLFLGSRRKV